MVLRYTQDTSFWKGNESFEFKPDYKIEKAEDDHKPPAKPGSPDWREGYMRTKMDVLQHQQPHTRMSKLGVPFHAGKGTVKFLRPTDYEEVIDAILKKNDLNWERKFTTPGGLGMGIGVTVNGTDYILDKRDAINNGEPFLVPAAEFEINYEGVPNFLSAGDSLPQKDFPVMVSPEGKRYPLVAHAVDIRTGWEWYGFEDMKDGTYFGYVMGNDNEFGYFSAQELKENHVPFTTDPKDLKELMPPIGWSREGGDESNSEGETEELKDLEKAGKKGMHQVGHVRIRDGKPYIVGGKARVPELYISPELLDAARDKITSGVSEVDAKTELMESGEYDERQVDAALNEVVKEQGLLEDMNKSQRESFSALDSTQKKFYLGWLREVKT